MGGAGEGAVGFVAVEAFVEQVVGGEYQPQFRGGLPAGGGVKEHEIAVVADDEMREIMEDIDWYLDD